MTGCALYRGRILSLGSRDSSPARALEAARHLARCAACAAERARLEAIDRELARLPEVEVPGSFSRRVMHALRSRGPVAVKAGAIVAAVLLVSGLLAAGGLSLGHAELLPPLPIETAETLGGAAPDLFGSVAVLLTAALRPGAASPFHAGSPAFHPVHILAFLALLMGHALLVMTVVVSHARARSAPRR